MPHLILSKGSNEDLSLLRFESEADSQGGKGMVSFAEEQVRAWKNWLCEVGAGAHILESVGKWENESRARPEVIVTGQQLGVGISPILTLYKMFYAEYLAKELSTDAHTVYPVFWMQSEDHDLKEVLDCCYAVDQNAPISILDAYQEKFYNNRISVGRLLSKEVLDSFWKQVAPDYLENDFMEIFRRYYQSETDTLSTSYAKLFYRLFPDSQIIFFNISNAPCDELKKATLRIALESEEVISDLLERRRDTLVEQGKTVPVHIRRNSPLFFYHPEGAAGPRYRLTRVDNEEYKIEELNLTVTKKELINNIELYPACFSTSALLRPLLQDSIFNVKAYVGGAAEIAYLAQIEDLYPLFGIKQPLRILRPQGVILPDKQYEQFKDSRVSLFSDYAVVRDGLSAEHIDTFTRADMLRETIEKEYVVPLEKLLSMSITEDVTLETPKDKTITRVREGISLFLQKLHSSDLRKAEVRVQRIEKYLSFVFFQKEKNQYMHQERILSLSYFGILYGREFVGTLRDMFFSSIREKNNTVVPTQILGE